MLVDTEKDGHRVTFNQAFKEKGLDAVWGVEEYGELVKIGGGKERMTKCGFPFFAPANFPANASELGLNTAKILTKRARERAQVLLGLSRQGAMGVPEGASPDLSMAWARLSPARSSHQARASSRWRPRYSDDASSAGAASRRLRSSRRTSRRCTC